MNERINELFDKALDEVVPNTWTNLTMDQLNDIKNKFAELIAKKFDDILLLQQLDCIGNHDRKSAELIEKIRENTKTYFGVE